jgi:uncharacterized protein with LGFP repeats
VPPAWDFWPTPSWVGALEGRAFGWYSAELLAWVSAHYRDPVAYLRARQAEEDGAVPASPPAVVPVLNPNPEEAWTMALTEQQWEVLGARAFGRFPFLAQYRARHAIPTAWVAEAQKPGGYLGKAKAAEREFADGSGGRYQEFERGVIAWDPAPERGVTVLR